LASNLSATSFEPASNQWNLAFISRRSTSRSIYLVAYDDRASHDVIASASHDVIGQQVVVDKHEPQQTGHVGQEQRREELKVDLDSQLTTQVSMERRETTQQPLDNSKEYNY